jgi:hypothetical protein
MRKQNHHLLGIAVYVTVSSLKNNNVASTQNSEISVFPYVILE